MAMKKLSIAGTVTFLKPAEMEVGQVVRGIFVETTKSRDYDSLNHRIRTSEGDFSINGTGQLDRLLEQVTAGQAVAITYKGKETLTKGKFKGKESHQFEVEADEEVGEVPPAATPQPKKPASMKKVS